MRKRVWVGIDVSAKELVVAVDNGRGPTRSLSFPNDAAGHRTLVRRLTRTGAEVRVCLEATGVYHLDAALALHEASRVEVMVANPRATRDFARAHMNRSKTDATDARSILEFGRRMEFAAWTPPSREIRDLRAIGRHMSSLAVMRAQERNRLHHHRQVTKLAPAIRESIEQHIEYIQESIDELRKTAIAIIRRDDTLRRQFEQLVSVKGIAETSGIMILAELSTLPSDMTTRQWVAHAGLDPRQIESGTSVRGRVRISKVGNRNLRRALFLPAMVACQHEPRVRAYYEALIARGKKPLQAIVAVMRKLLHAIHGMFRTGHDFDGLKFRAGGLT